MGALISFATGSLPPWERGSAHFIRATIADAGSDASPCDKPAAPMGGSWGGGAGAMGAVRGLEEAGGGFGDCGGEAQVGGGGVMAEETEGEDVGFFLGAGVGGECFGFFGGGGSGVEGPACE